MKPDPARAALAQAQGLLEILRADPELYALAVLAAPLVVELRRRCGLLDFAAVEPDGNGADFERFWQAYPVKTGKRDAEKAWKRSKRPGIKAILAALEAQKASARWRAGTIPNPATWINSGRWDDDPATLTAVGNGRVEPLSGLRSPQREDGWAALVCRHGDRWHDCAICQAGCANCGAPTYEHDTEAPWAADGCPGWRDREGT